MPDFPNELSPKEQIAIVRQHVQALREHFDCVQILVSHVTDRGTEDIFDGNGNWYARQGMAREFLNRDQAVTDAHELSKTLNKSTDDL